MSKISPYVRSQTEHSQNWRATAIFLSVSAAIFLVAALWIDFDPPPKPPEPPNGTSTQVLEAKPVPPPNAARDTGQPAVDWSSRVAAIQQELPTSLNAELKPLVSRLQSVSGLLSDVKLSADRQGLIKRDLDELKQQAAILADQVQRPSVQAEGIAEAIASTAQAIVLAEREATRQAQEQAEREIRQNMEPTIRVIRMETSDFKDQAIDLRKQIAQLQKEQAEFKGKEIRLAALQREMTDVKKYLQSFTTAGHVHPKSERSAWDGEITVDASPVSLTRLKRLGALEPTMDGLRKLYIFGGSKNPALRNDRPLGEFPQYWAQHLEKPEVLKVVKRAQELLRDHGQAMVEQQLLSP